MRVCGSRGVPLAATVLAAVTLLAGTALLTGCGRQISGTPISVGARGQSNPPATKDSRPAREKITAPPDIMGGAGMPNAGDCITSKDFKNVECARPHDLEVLSFGNLPAGMPTAYPDTVTLSKAALPGCRALLVQFAGSADADATRIQAWAFWPSEKGWANGDRWLLCGAAEIGPDDKALSRTGSLKGVLGAGGFATFQLCVADSPAKESKLRSIACDQPHLGEALPGVLVLGKATDPVPSAEAINAQAKQHCTSSLANYLGATRKDVSASWRMPNAEVWVQGQTSITCYAEPTRPVSGRLQGIGNGSLPG